MLLLVNQLPILLVLLQSMLILKERRRHIVDRTYTLPLPPSPPLSIKCACTTLSLPLSIVEHKTGEKSDWKSVYKINDKVGVARVWPFININHRRKVLEST